MTLRPQDGRQIMEGLIQSLQEKVERYEKALIYLSDCTNYMDFDFVLDHVEEIAKEALKEK